MTAHLGKDGEIKGRGECSVIGMESGLRQRSDICWGRWELNPGPMGEQPVLLTTEQSLQHGHFTVRQPRITRQVYQIVGFISFTFTQGVVCICKVSLCW